MLPTRYRNVTERFRVRVEAWSRAIRAGATMGASRADVPNAGGASARGATTGGAVRGRKGGAGRASGLER